MEPEEQAGEQPDDADDRQLPEEDPPETDS
jgi:hypothetical protein